MQDNSGEWTARVLPDVVLIQDGAGNLYRLNTPCPDIWGVACWIRNQPGVHRMAKINPFQDTRQTRKYVEYHYMTFPF